jgi:hypothetical protein
MPRGTRRVSLVERREVPMRALMFCPILMTAIGCAEVSAPPAASPEPTRVASLDGVRRDIEPDPKPVASPSDAGRVLVLETTKLDRYAEVVGVVDVHKAMGTEQAALAALRRKAAAMGADAVVGVEFHHGDAEGEPTHLSGVAVRLMSPSSVPRD